MSEEYPDGVDEFRRDPVYVASILSPADPANLKEAFNMLIDGVISNADGDILDWGTAEFSSVRALSGQGQELLYLGATVRALAVGG